MAGEVMEELWMSLPDYPNYIVSNTGLLHNSKYNKRIKGYTGKRGETRVSLTNEQGRLETELHILVASLFLGNYVKGRQVRHIDGDRSNNNVSNLTQAISPTHRYSIMESEYCKGKSVEILQTGEVFPSVVALADSLGTRPSNIYRVLSGKRPHYRGISFRWVE